MQIKLKIAKQYSTIESENMITNLNSQDYSLNKMQHIKTIK